jgi:hypothetical protein
MNAEQAKTILALYQPSDPVAVDPEVAEALAWVKRDPALAQWFAQQQAFDQTMAAGLQAIEVPPDLKSAVLAEHRASCRSRRSEESWFAWLVEWARAPREAGDTARLAVATSLLLLSGVAGLWATRETPSFERYRERVVRASWGTDQHLSFAASDLNQVKAWLAQHQVRTDFALPAGLNAAKLRGCNVLEIGSHKVALLCFWDESKHLHFLIGDAPDFEDTPVARSPQFAESEGWPVVSWRHADKVYLLIGMKYSTFVRKFRTSGRWLLES